ncbi:MAG: 5' nucleotidase, NT5C type [bacterium]
MDRNYLHKIVDEIPDSKLIEAQRCLERLWPGRRDFVFGVDLDGVCADFYAGMRPIAAKWLGVELETLTPEVSVGLREWGVDKAPGGYPALHRYAVTQCDLFRNLQPVPGAPQALRRLSEKGVRIRIITHRLYIKYFHQKAIDQTIEWLDRHDIPYWDLCFMKDKAAVGANLYIDDSPENVVRLRDAGLRAIVFSNSTNRDLAGPRADNWTEVEKIVLDEMEQWNVRRASAGR